MERLEILKTYKLYIGGKFPRGESGHYYTPKQGNKSLGNVCLGTRKDLRDAVVAAKAGFGAWSSATAFNRSQVIYRIAEMLEGRNSQFVDELIQMGLTEAKARAEVEASIDTLVYFAGWCDKLQQLFGAVNPVAGSYFNFSVYEPQGIIGIIAPEDSPLLGLVTTICFGITGGNSVVVLASENKPLCAVTLGEVLHSSDVPAGTINIITGTQQDLYKHFASHKDINAVLYCRNQQDVFTEIEKISVTNLKRVHHVNFDNWHDKKTRQPWYILDCMEVKTTWHPIENIGSSGSGY